MRAAEVAASLVLLLFGVYVTVGALRLAYAEEGIPGPGFAPFWIGLGLGVTSALNLASALMARRAPSRLVGAGVVPRLAALGGITVAWVAVMPLLGMVASLAVFMGVAPWALGMRRRRVLLGLMVLVPAGFYLVFERLLGVPLPRGAWR